MGKRKVTSPKALASNLFTTSKAS